MHRSGTIIDEDTVYLEDLVNNTPQASLSKGKTKQKVTPESATKRSKFHDHDPYRLPEVDLEAMTKPTSSDAPDPRLATEEELRVFIESMRPEDFDVNSPAFRDLPTEIKYEIVGDLRLKSRQTSHKRLQAMLRNSKTPLDFSKAQIRNLQQRNALTQQLLETTDSISKANVMIPIRIASERNKEYILIKNEGEEGGWVLGIQNEGTQEKPIVLDEDVEQNSEDEESGAEMEEVSV
jgi:DNA excision repair protein ERCC-5